MKPPASLALLAGLLPGCHAGLGPVLSYRFDDDARVGWEASGGYAVARASVGQAFGYGEQGDTDFYVAAEPGLLVGLTLGVDHASDEGWGFMPGAWAGVPFYELQNPSYAVRGFDMFGTVALGYRYAHGHEMYLAPKLFLMEQVTIAH